MVKDTVETVFKITESMNQPRSLSFSVDGDTLFISNDQDKADNGISTAIALRSSGFKKVTPLIYQKVAAVQAVIPFTLENIFTINGIKEISLSGISQPKREKNYIKL